MLDAKDRVLAGVSGGADSVCLVLVLKELGYDVSVAHVHHGLRGVAADEDEAFTRALADRLGMRFFSKRVVIAGVDKNIEAAGRKARKEFFSELVRSQGLTKIAVAHTASDRVETFMMNLLRGSGSEGLVSMAPASGTTVRPLIETPRPEIEAYLRDQNQAWCSDSTNFDLRFARNRLRQVVIPDLSAGFNPRLLETLGKTLEILADEDAWMRSITDPWLNVNGTKQDDEFVLDVHALKPAPAAFVRRILRGALRHAGSELHDVRFEHIEAIRRLLESGKSGKLVEIPGGLVVAREFDRLIFRQRATAPDDYDYELTIPGEIRIPELAKVFRAEIVDKEADETSPERIFVDGESIGPCVRIRNWKPGDYYRPVGWPAGKLKKLFQRARIPRSHRRNWPVVVANSTIVWVASFPVSREFAPGACSQRIVAIEALPV